MTLVELDQAIDRNRRVALACAFLCRRLGYVTLGIGGAWLAHLVWLVQTQAPLTPYTRFEVLLLLLLFACWMAGGVVVFIGARAHRAFLAAVREVEAITKGTR